MLKTTKVSGHTEIGSQIVDCSTFLDGLRSLLVEVKEEEKAGRAAVSGASDVYLKRCDDDGQNTSTFDKSPNSMSLVPLPSSLCTQAWTQMDSDGCF